MKEVAKITLYLAGAVLLAALLSPWVFWTLGALERWALANGLENWDPRYSSVVVNGPLDFFTTSFEQCFGGTLLLSALVVFLIAAHGFGKTTRRYLRLRPDPLPFRHLARGFLVTALLFAITAGAYVLANVRHLQSPLPLGRLPSVLAMTALIVLIREIVFRGGVLGSLLRVMRPVPALAWATLLATAFQLLDPYNQPRVAHVSWLSGFHLLPHLFHAYREPVTLLCGAAPAAALGWLYGYARVRIDSLWMTIGLAWGVAFANRTANLIEASSRQILPWIGRDLVTGLVPLLPVMLAGFLVWRRLDYEEILQKPRD